MAARLRLVSNWDDDVSQPDDGANSIASSARSPRTLRGRPRVVATPRATSVAPEQRNRLRRSHRLGSGQRTQPLSDLQRDNDHTLAYAALEATAPRRAPRVARRAPERRPDLDLGSARQDYQAEGSALIQLSQLHARSHQSWVAFGVGAAMTAVLLFVFFG